MKRHKNSRHKGNLIHIAKNVTNSDTLHSEKAIKIGLPQNVPTEKKPIGELRRMSRKKSTKFRSCEATIFA